MSKRTCSSPIALLSCCPAWLQDVPRSAWSLPFFHRSMVYLLWISWDDFVLDMVSLGTASWLEWEDQVLQSSSAIPGRHTALPTVVPQLGMVPLGGGNLVPWGIRA